MKNLYKIIAVDMDGTLLKSDKTIHQDSIRDIQTAAANGIYVVYCTGRSISELQSYFEILPMIKYAVCYSGAIVYDRIEKNCIYRAEIEQTIIKKIVKTAKKYKAMIHFSTERESIVAAADVTHMADFHMGVYQPMFMEITRKVPDMEEEGMLHHSIAKVNLYFRSEEDRNNGYDELKQLPLTFAFSEKTSLEMTALCVNKATGLEHLAEYLHIPISQTVGIGDADNDKDMLRKAGFSVAMGNASDAIKNCCNFVTKDNNHNGVGAAIQYVMGMSNAL